MLDTMKTQFELLSPSLSVCLFVSLILSLFRVRVRSLFRSLIKIPAWYLQWTLVIFEVEWDLWDLLLLKKNVKFLFEEYHSSIRLSIQPHSCSFIHQVAAFHLNLNTLLVSSTIIKC